MSGEPIVENVLPQDNLNEIGNTDNVVNETSVSKKDGPSTPPLGECMDCTAEVNEQQRLMTTQEHHTPATQEADVLMTEDELILMNIPQLPTQGTQEVVTADASVTSFSQNHSFSQEDVTAAIGFDAIATVVPDAQSLMIATISSQLSLDHNDDLGRFGKNDSNPLVPDDNSVSGDNDANSDDHPTATVFVDKAVTAKSLEAPVVILEGGKPGFHATHATT